VLFSAVARLLQQAPCTDRLAGGLSRVKRVTGEADPTATRRAASAPATSITRPVTPCQVYSQSETKDWFRTACLTSNVFVKSHVTCHPPPEKCLFGPGKYKGQSASFSFQGGLRRFGRAEVPEKRGRGTRNPASAISPVTEQSRRGGGGGSRRRCALRRVFSVRTPRTQFVPADLLHAPRA
jgi:hypothetical protein